MYSVNFGSKHPVPQPIRSSEQVHEANLIMVHMKKLDQCQAAISWDARIQIKVVWVPNYPTLPYICEQIFLGI